MKNKSEHNDFKSEMLNFELKGSDYHLIFEDNGRVAYAYLYKGSKIIGDVWLYNVSSAPLEPEWKDKLKIPFANPKKFISNRIVKPVSSKEEIKVVWEKDKDGNLSIALIYLRDELFAGISPGSKPGWSKLTVRNGPLSKVMPTDKKIADL